MPSIGPLLSGTGVTSEPLSYHLRGYPLVYMGGEVDTLTVGSGGASGEMTYYGLDNTLVDVLQLECYRDVVIEPIVGRAQANFYGYQRSEIALTGYRATMTVTKDLTDLLYLREFLRQADSHYDAIGVVPKSLIVGHAEPALAHMPVLFQSDIDDCASATDQIWAILAFEAAVWMGAIQFDPILGPNAPLEFDIFWSPVYDGFLSIVSGDD